MDYLLTYTNIRGYQRNKNYVANEQEKENNNSFSDKYSFVTEWSVSDTKMDDKSSAQRQNDDFIVEW